MHVSVSLRIFHTCMCLPPSVCFTHADMVAYAPEAPDDVGKYDSTHRHNSLDAVLSSYYDVGPFPAHRVFLDYSGAMVTTVTNTGTGVDGNAQVASPKVDGGPTIAAEVDTAGDAGAGGGIDANLGGVEGFEPDKP